MSESRKPGEVCWSCLGILISAEFESRSNWLCKMQINASDTAEPYFIRRFAMVVLVAALTFGCDQAPPEKTQGVKPPSVTVALPLQKRITEWDEFTGRFEAVETVEVRARVSVPFGMSAIGGKADLNHRVAECPLFCHVWTFQRVRKPFLFLTPGLGLSHERKP